LPCGGPDKFPWQQVLVYRGKYEGHPVTLVYKNEGSDKRCFKLNGKQTVGEFNDLMNVENLFIPSNEISDGMIIEVID